MDDVPSWRNTMPGLIFLWSFHLLAALLSLQAQKLATMLTRNERVSMGWKCLSGCPFVSSASLEV
jgi:hypothetical protein